MIESEHTLGPWVIGRWDILPEDRDEKGYGKAWTLVEANDTEMTIAKGPFGRKAKSPDSIIETTGYECDGIFIDNANAHLIAAAPELLEALEAFKQVLSQDWGEDAIKAGFAPSMMLGSAIEKAKIALAKAKHE